REILDSAIDLDELYDGEVFAADWDHDGFPDLLAGRSIVHGNGDGTFGATRVVPDADPRALEALDVDGDGWPDLAILDGAGVRIALGPDPRPDGRLLPLADPSGMAFGDLDGDGRPDLVVTRATARRIEVVYGVGSASARGTVIPI